MRRLYGVGTGNLAADAGGGSTSVTNTMINDSSYTASVFGNGEIYIPNYSIAGISKSLSIDGVTENRAITALTMITGGFWSVTDAITTIRLTAASGGNFVGRLHILPIRYLCCYLYT
jgi:hypothetical protein